MPPPELPTRCQTCSKSQGHPVHPSCEFCTHVVFNEQILCDLNREVQPQDDGFTCHAFQPKLKLITPDGEVEPRPGHQERLLAQRAERLKRNAASSESYNKSLAVQQAQRHPDDVIVQLKFHSVWNVTQRKPIFADGSAPIEQLMEALANSSIPSVTFAGLLWLAVDHIHVYFESDGERSPVSIINDLKGISAKIIANQSAVPDGPWDKAYFVETISP